MFIDKKQKVNKLSNDRFNTKYGFLNRGDNNSVFINLNSWVKIINDDPDVNYNQEFNKIIKRIKQHLFNDYDFFNKNLTVVNTDIRQNGFNPNSNSFLNLEITLFAKSSKEKFSGTDELNSNLINLIDNVINQYLIDSGNFVFKNKK